MNALPAEVQDPGGENWGSYVKVESSPGNERGSKRNVRKFQNGGAARGASSS